MNALRDRLLKASTLEYADVLDDSEIYNNKDFITTPIPILNVAYSADPFGGLAPGLTVWAGPSKHFKTLFCLISAAAYLLKYPDAICIFYDNEFGSPKAYFKSAGIDPKRVIHSPFLNLEELRTDLANTLKEINRGDKVVIIVDSMGNGASSKEIKDAEDGSEKADMTRAKVTKSLFRIATPHLRLKDIPMLVVAHTYDTMEMYSKKVVSGGTGIYYSADNVYIVGRQQEKETATKNKGDLLGYNFTINVDKSRYVREKSQLNITVKFEGGVQKWSGLFDIAVDGGYITQTGKKYQLVDKSTGEVADDSFSRNEIENSGAFWKTIFDKTDFSKYIQDSFAVATGSLISEDVNTEVDQVNE